MRCACSGFPAFSLAFSLAAAAFVLGVAGCRSKPSPVSRAAPSASASSSAAVPACRALAPAFALGAGTGGAAAGDQAADEDDVPELPGGVELGEAQSASGYFAVGGLERGGKSATAFVVFVDEQGRARREELGSVSGEVDPPQLAATKERLVAFAAESDARGMTLQPFALDPAAAGAKPRRGADIPEASRDGFGIGVQGERVLVAYGRRSGKRVALVVQALDAKELALQGEPRGVPLADEREPEAPRLLPHEGGFHLAWIGRGKLDALPPPRKLAEAEGAVDDSLLALGPSALELVSLDALGAPIGEPVRLTAPEARVLSYDMAPLPDGGVLFAYRDERHGVEVNSASLEVLLVRADGTRETRTWNVASVGLPSLLVDPTPRAPGWGVLAFSSEDAARVVPFGPGLAAELPALGVDVPGGEAIAALGGRWLRSRTRGARVELDVVECAVPRE